MNDANVFVVLPQELQFTAASSQEHIGAAKVLVAVAFVAIDVQLQSKQTTTAMDAGRICSDAHQLATDRLL